MQCVEKITVNHWSILGRLCPETQQMPVPTRYPHAAPRSQSIRSSSFLPAQPGLATVALFSRQPMLIAYILLGCLIGPFGLSLIDQNELLTEIAEIGIIFLLFSRRFRFAAQQTEEHAWPSPCSRPWAPVLRYSLQWAPLRDAGHRL